MCPEGAQVELERERCVPKGLKLSFEVKECKPLADGAIVGSGVLELAAGSSADGIAMLRMMRVMRIFAGLKSLRRYRAFRRVFASIANGKPLVDPINLNPKPQNPKP